jgi:two-component system, response regulator RegA
MTSAARRHLSSAAPRSVLLVDDDRLLLAGLERYLRARGMAVTSASEIDEALYKARLKRPELAVLDLYLGDASGLSLLRALKRELPDLVVVFLSGSAGVPHAVEAMQGGAVDFLQKPIGGGELYAALERAAERARLAGSSLARAEFDHIRRVLDDCGGNISEAARRLKIHRRSLQRKLQKRPPSK